MLHRSLPVKSSAATGSKGLLLNSGKVRVPATPFALRKDMIPTSFAAEHLPHGWVREAEAWCDRVLAPHIAKAPSSFAQRHAGFGGTSTSRASHHLFLKCLITNSYLAGCQGLDPRVRAMVQPPQALLPTGLNVLKLTANTLSLFGGHVPSEASLVTLLPMDRMEQVSARWGLADVLLYDRAGQIEQVRANGDDKAMPVRLVPSALVQIIGAVSLMHGVGTAGDLAVAEVFPEMKRQAPSTAPLVIL